MTDRFRNTFPISISIATGEQPTGAKLSAIASQAKAGLGLVERAIGDVWGQSGDSTLRDYPLQVVNISRVIGQQWKGNALLPKPDASDGTVIYVNQTLTSQIGHSEILLNFIPVVDATLTSNMSAAGFTTSVVSRALIDSGTDYFIDAINGKIYLGKSWTQSTLTYGVDALNFIGDDSDTGGFNVIPDPRTISNGWEGLKFYKVSANKYLMFLPPRCPTTLAGVGHVPENSATNRATVSTTFKYYFPLSNDSVVSTPLIFNPISQQHQYRYSLPEEISDLLTDSGTTGTSLPEGFLHLWDNTTQTIVEGVSFRVPETNPAYSSGISPRPRWVLQIQGANLDELLTSYHTATIATDAAAHYQNRFSLITVGQSLSKTVGYLREQSNKHAHDVGAQSRIKHSSLTGNTPATTAAFLTGLPEISTTASEGDDHPLYISRSGSTSTSANQRDRYNNGMLGDLLFLSTASGSNYQNLTSVSNKIYFGSLSGANLGYDSTNTPTIVTSSGTLRSTGSLGLGTSAPRSSTGLYLFGTSTNNGIDYQETANLFRFFTSANVPDSRLAAGTYVVAGSTYSTASTNDYTSLIATSKWMRLNASSTNPLIDYKGGLLDISAVSGDTNDVIVGGTNTSTDLRIANRKIFMGDSNTTSSMEYNASTSFSFIASGNLNTSKVFASEFRATNDNAVLGANYLTMRVIGAAANNGIVTWDRDNDELQLPNIFPDTVKVVEEDGYRFNAARTKWINIPLVVCMQTEDASGGAFSNVHATATDASTSGDTTGTCALTIDTGIVNGAASGTAWFSIPNRHEGWEPKSVRIVCRLSSGTRTGQVRIATAQVDPTTFAGVTDPTTIQLGTSGSVSITTSYQNFEVPLTSGSFLATTPGYLGFLWQNTSGGTILSGANFWIKAIFLEVEETSL